MAATDLPCVTFATHSIPDITRNDSLLAICTVPQPYCQPDSLAFHAADFLAFKHLFFERYPPEQQAWLSTCNPRHLSLLQHGSKNVKGVFDDSVSVHKDPASLMESFIQHIKKMANDIRFRGPNAKGKLAIIVCGPTSPQQDILKELPHPLSVEDTAQFLHVEDLREIIGHGVDAMLITPNMHVGGWVVNMSLARSTPARPTPSEKGFMIRRTLRNTAPLFVDSAFATLLQADSFMRHTPDKQNEASVMPASPTPSQLAAQSKFFGTLHEASFGSLVVAPRMSTFNFIVELDNWMELCGLREGPQLVDHAKRWQMLPEHGVNSVSRSPFPYYCFGHSQESQLMHLKTLAFILRPEWTRDETDRGNHELQAVFDTAFGLESTADGMEEPHIEQAYIRFIHISVYRQALMSLADAVVHICGLEPLQARCLRWPMAEAEHRFGIELDWPVVGKSMLESICEVLPLMPGSTPRLASPLTYGTANDHFLRPALYLWRTMAAQVSSQPQTVSELESDVVPDMAVFFNNLVDGNVSPRPFVRASPLIRLTVIHELRDRTPKTIIQASPWAAGAGYALLRLLDKGPCSYNLRAGTNTKAATGVAGMPSEMMRKRGDPNGSSQANWRGGSRRAGGINSSSGRKWNKPWRTGPNSHTPKAFGRPKQQPLSRAANASGNVPFRHHGRPKEQAGVHGGVNRFKSPMATETPARCYYPESSDEWIRRHEQPHQLQEVSTPKDSPRRDSSKYEESEYLIDFSNNDGDIEMTDDIGRKPQEEDLLY